MKTTLTQYSKHQISPLTENPSNLDSLEQRIWLTEYNKEAVIAIRKNQNTEYWKTVDDKNRQYIKKIHSYLKENQKPSVQELEECIYSLPKKEHAEEKELKKRNEPSSSISTNSLLPKIVVLASAHSSGHSQGRQCSTSSMNQGKRCLRARHVECCNTCKKLQDTDYKNIQQASMKEVRAERIELSFSAWKADVLPLNYAR